MTTGFHRIDNDDNCTSLRDQIDFWTGWSSDLPPIMGKVDAVLFRNNMHIKFPKQRQPFDQNFVFAMVGFMRSDWVPAERFLHKPVGDLFVCEHAPFRDSKGKPFSRSEVRRRKGSLFVNDILVDEELTLEPEMLIEGRWAVLQDGKRRPTAHYWMVGVDKHVFSPVMEEVREVLWSNGIRIVFP